MWAILLPTNPSRFSQRMPNTDSNQPETGGESSMSSATRTPWIVLVLPLVVVCAILFVSPNFQPVDGMRSAPLGSDFLQEWIGGSIIASAESNLLYDSVHSKKLQHDPDLVGFQWPAEKYFPMVYPPYYYSAVSPLSALDYSLAIKVWGLLSAVAFSISGYMLYRFFRPGRRLLGFIWLLALLFVPLLNCFNMGQKSTLLLLILTSSFLLLHHRRPFSAGLVFGLIAIKPHLGIVIGLTMLLKKQWQFAAGAVLMVAILCGSSYLFYPQLFLDYFKVIAGMGDYVQTGGYQLFDSHSLWGTAQLTFSWLPPVGVKVIAALLSLVVVGLLWQVMRGPIETSSIQFAIQFAAMVFATVMLSPHFYTYDLTILLLPLLLIASAFPPGTWREQPVDRTLGFVLIGFFAFAGLFSQIAEMIGIQVSILLMMAVLVLLGLTKSHTKTASPIA